MKLCWLIINSSWLPAESLTTNRVIKRVKQENLFIIRPSTSVSNFNLIFYCLFKRRCRRNFPRDREKRCHEFRFIEMKIRPFYAFREPRSCNHVCFLFLSTDDFDVSIETSRSNEDQRRVFLIAFSLQPRALMFLMFSKKKPQSKVHQNVMMIYWGRLCRCPR